MQQGYNRADGYRTDGRKLYAFSQVNSYNLDLELCLEETDSRWSLFFFQLAQNKEKGSSLKI